LDQVVEDLGSLWFMVENIKHKIFMCCESDSKLEKLKFVEAVKIGARFGEIGARFSGAELALSFVKNRSTI